MVLREPAEVGRLWLGKEASMTDRQFIEVRGARENNLKDISLNIPKQGSVYVMDEPTTGLHRSDIGLLMGIIDRLVDAGNTVILIEHHLDVIRQADWIMDLGLEGGSAGGDVLFEGPPSELKKCERSITARFI